MTAETIRIVHGPFGVAFTAIVALESPSNRYDTSPNRYDTPLDRRMIRIAEFVRMDPLALPPVDREDLD